MLYVEPKIDLPWSDDHSVIDFEYCLFLLLVHDSVVASLVLVVGLSGLVRARQAQDSKSES